MTGTLPSSEHVTRYGRMPESIFYKQGKIYGVHGLISQLTKSGFDKLEVFSSPFRRLDDIKELEQAKPGYGD